MQKRFVSRVFLSFLLCITSRILMNKLHPVIFFSTASKRPNCSLKLIQIQVFKKYTVILSWSPFSSLPICHLWSLTRRLCRGVSVCVFVHVCRSTQAISAGVSMQFFKNSFSATYGISHCILALPVCFTVFWCKPCWPEAFQTRLRIEHYIFPFDEATFPNPSFKAALQWKVG